MPPKHAPGDLNLVTCCLDCNQNKGDLPVKVFLQVLWEEKAEARCLEVLRQRAKPLDRARARELLSTSGTAARAAREMRQ